MSKPRVLVLGGVGFIGRNLVVELVTQQFASKIRVVDKAVPQTSYLTAAQAAAFAQVEFVQANLAKDVSVEKAFRDEAPFDYVFNCAGLTKYGQEDVVYKENVFDVTVKCAAAAAKQNVKRFVEISTAQVYSSDKKESDESSKVKPWTSLAESKFQAEEELKKIPGLNFVIVRPPIVYGSSDRLGLMPRLIVGAVYKKLGETMKLLWSDKLRLHTVHVHDLVRALWFLAERGENGHVYNIVDKSDTTQGTITELVCKIFGIKHDYFGSILSNLAKLNMSGATEDSNEKHLEPWGELCKAEGITNTPLSPYLDQELLYNNNLAVEGSKLEKLGFVYQHPVLTEADLRACLQEYIDLNLFPRACLA